MYMYICIYSFINVCICKYIHIYVHLYTSVHTYMYIYVYLHSHLKHTHAVCFFLACTSDSTSNAVLCCERDPRSFSREMSDCDLAWQQPIKTGTHTLFARDIHVEIRPSHSSAPHDPWAPASSDPTAGNIFTYNTDLEL